MNILENQQLAESVDGIYIDLEAQILQNIARHLQGWEQPIDTDRWLLQKLAEIGKLNQENIRLIAQMSGMSQTMAESLLNVAAEDAIKNMDPGLRYLARRGLAEEAVSANKSKNVKRAVNGFHKQAKDTLNMCNTNMLYKASEKYRGLVQNIAREAWNILNSGAGGVVSGVEARQQAVRRCIRQLNDKGIPAFVDKRGREWTPEAYVNMAMRNTARSTAEEVQDARIRDAGCNLIQIDSHSGARPKCAKDQGKIFDLNNGSGYTEDLHGKKIRYYPWKSSSYGEPDGILGINCRHHKWPFIPGVNVQRYFPTEDMDANDKLYKQTQVQRALERDIRKQKRECMMLDVAGDQDGFEEAAVKLKSKEAQLKDYVDKNGQLHRRRDREQVVGFDKTVSAGAVSAAQKNYKNWAKSIGAETGPKNLAGYYELKYNDSKESRLYKGYVKAVKSGNISPLVGYDNFKKYHADLEKGFIGMVTVDGKEIRGITAHFTDRMFGTHEWVNDPSPDQEERFKDFNHKAPSVEDVKDALLNPKKIGPINTRKDGNRSQVYFGKKANVSYNPDTKELVQTEGK